MKPLFTDKVQTSSSITLVENEKLITNDSEIAEIFNEFFTNITKTMDMPLVSAHLVRQNICWTLLKLLLKSINIIPAFKI